MTTPLRSALLAEREAPLLDRVRALIEGHNFLHAVDELALYRAFITPPMLPPAARDLVVAHLADGARGLAEREPGIVPAEAWAPLVAAELASRAAVEAKALANRGAAERAANEEIASASVRRARDEKKRAHVAADEVAKANASGE